MAKAAYRIDGQGRVIVTCDVCGKELVEDGEAFMACGCCSCDGDGGTDCQACNGIETVCADCADEHRTIEACAEYRADVTRGWTRQDWKAYYEGI